jgi:uncharacterized SAM-binding protein YcdF (DUF218 family)
MMRRRRTRGGRFIAGLAVLAAIFWLVGLLLFVENIPRSKPDDTLTDAVVVLTGGPGRINRGIELLASEKARELLISGVGADVPMRDLISDNALPKSRLECCVTLGRAARDTRENAIEAAGWAASRNIVSIRLVTSDFHMPRSLLEFERRLPQLQIIPEPVGTKSITMGRWWLRPDTVVLLAGEYSKFLAVRLQLAFTRLIMSL